MIKLYNNDCLKQLKELADNSVDSIITDPPYELGFMGKSWDNTGIAKNKEMWAECLRILKHGGHLLAFGGTRTYHRMACAIEDAGFEVRDMIEWVYGSGFPKNLNVGVAVNKLETNEWSKIGKALDNINKNSIIEVWKNNSSNVKIAKTQSLNLKEKVGCNTPSESFAQENVVQNTSQESSNLIVNFVKQDLNEVPAINTKISIALQSVEAEIRQLQNLAKSAKRLSRNQNHKSWNIFTAQCDVKEWLNENTVVNHGVDEALKTLRGNKKYSNEEITNVLCAALQSVLKLTILNQSKTFQNLDMNQKMECASAINVIITEYTAENLISNTVAILKSKAIDKLQGNERQIIGIDKSGKSSRAYQSEEKTTAGQYKIDKGTSQWEGWGTALKPAHEPICMARKPLAEKTVAENVLKWGTGGINIDESRVEAIDQKELEKNWTERKADAGFNGDKTGIYGQGQMTEKTIKEYAPSGRFPANLITDNSEEVRECFPESSKGWGKATNSETFGDKSMFGIGGVNANRYDMGGESSARFFKSIIYQAKASKSERNEGCEELPNREIFPQNNSIERKELNSTANTKTKNNHPTVKPTALMQYLIKMITPKGGIVLDPFMGSGSTGKACIKDGFSFIGIEKEEEYFKIAEARILTKDKQLKF
jgi:DNA modification methylase